MVDTIFKETTAEGFTGFHWNSADYGAWDGPLSDWTDSHSHVVGKLPKRRTVVQAGGNLGMYPCFLSKYFDEVYTFEADPDNFDILEKNLKHYHIGNVVAMNYALGESIRKTGIARPNSRNVGMNHIDDNSEIPVSMITLDSVPGFIKNVDLLWLDIEGYEFPALKGALHLIENNRPTIMVERAGYEIDNMLAPYGYERAGESIMDTIYRMKGMV